ncbi:alpha/beta hydrolase [Roseateles asaccharophilus]|uniref:Pimeloyl-ACP methyl ester carboxylesterase n=1 Tax=Roseateles asaccharophilus TaxID=582607 RepID=A0ABU2A4Y0_9BURK|nr:alpha/beta hydrolase [Roseateles asaccharophilus]MDR7331678.1 pimeloyl-ACP methyl ester carboxylesterase [Roseateles asaccharophilus]
MTDTLVTSSLPIVCLHSSGAGGKQWRRLLADAGEAGIGWPWHTPDLLGHGGRPGWPADVASSLSFEADSVLAGLALPPDQPFHLMGHSYGGAVSLQLALQQPQRVRSLTLYEPVAFGVLDEDLPEWLEARQVAADVATALDRGDLDGAARGFVGYWQGRDVWPELDEGQRTRLAEPMPTIRRHFEALSAARWSDAQLTALRIPVQLICGGATRASARRVAQTLATKLPQARLDVLEGAAHLAPIGDAARVNPLLLAALRRVQSSAA